MNSSFETTIEVTQSTTTGVNLSFDHIFFHIYNVNELEHFQIELNVTERKFFTQNGRKTSGFIWVTDNSELLYVHVEFL